MTERKLRKCPVCGDWFNTTHDIILEHVAVHGRKPWVLVGLMAKAAELVVKLRDDSNMADYFKLRVELALTNDQFNRVLATRVEDLK